MSLAFVRPPAGRRSPGWRAALPQGAPLRIPGDLLARYLAGEVSAAAAGRQLGVSGPMVLRELRRLGIDTSPSARRIARSASRKGVRLPVAPARVPQEAALLYGRGWTLRRIGARFGLTPEGVRQIPQKRGVELRAGGAAAPRPGGCRR